MNKTRSIPSPITMKLQSIKYKEKNFKTHCDFLTCEPLNFMFPWSPTKYGTYQKRKSHYLNMVKSCLLFYTVLFNRIEPKKVNEPLKDKTMVAIWLIFNN
jgi:hypothetical protein